MKERENIEIAIAGNSNYIVPYALIAASVMIATYYITEPMTNIYIRFAAKIVIAAALYILCGLACRLHSRRA